ncbi:hypothetical protein K505DRAFT_367950 [Melanomma pulvis-pyrius CBS 109.77]|uniref:C2H2-type domain-containing protein n=1 Tax=Melanomma pulvis-pyrius CBS 109.77 TaxID=1314802 RepID=A0A6A6WSI8_9PLEO|nr:hypothetical protein K505DRAFT_367950 [Melanomma pulvis-pyrius CBS 109.77]
MSLQPQNVLFCICSRKTLQHGNQRGLNDISTSDPAVHAPVDDEQMTLLLDPAIQIYSDAGAGIDVNPNNQMPEPPANDQLMLPSAYDEWLADYDSSPSANFMKSIKGNEGAHRVTHPSTNVIHSEEYHQLASSKHYSNPPQVPPRMPYPTQDFDPLDERPLDDFSTPNEKSFTCMYPECGGEFTRKGQLTRHQRGCKLNPDPIKYTCLLHYSGHVQTFRADKIGPHLKEKHGWTRATVQDVPKAWLWPLVWAGQRHGWACKLCGDAAAPLGLWPADQDKFKRHIRDCGKGGMARTSRGLDARVDEEDEDGAGDEDGGGDYEPL